MPANQGFRIRKDRLPGSRSPALAGVRMTLAGLLFALVNLLVGAAALNNDASLLFLLFCLGLGVLLVSALMPLVMVHRVEADRVLPTAVFAGRPFSLVYIVRNPRRLWGAWSLVVGETPLERGPAGFPLGYVPCLRAGREERVELMGRCPGRGRIRLRGVAVSSRFPFGLFSCTVRIVRPGQLVVYPELGRLRKAGRGSGMADRIARHPPSRRWEGEEEFDGLRDYRDGDNPRRIHWRKSAHVGKLVLREDISVHLPQLIVLVDPWPDANPKRARVRENGEAGESERVISAAATAACAALEQGHHVGLIARGRVPVVIPPAGGRGHRQRLLKELALLEPGEAVALDELAGRSRWRSAGQLRCLLCVSRLESAHRRAMRLLARRAENVTLAAPGSEWLENVFSPPGQRSARGRAS